MISKNLLSAAQNLGLDYYDKKGAAKSCACGVYGDYLITVSDIGNKKTVFFSFYLDDEEENCAVKKLSMSESIKEKLSEYNIFDYVFTDDGLSVTCNDSVLKFLETIDFVIELLAENEIPGIKYCSHCGKEFGSSHVSKLNNDMKNHLVCDRCGLELIQAAHESAVPVQKTETKTKIANGILGSIIFGIIGIVIYFLLYRFLLPTVSATSFEVRYLFCALGLAVSALVYVGYRLFCKKISKSAYITVTAVSIVATAIGQFVGMFVSCANAWGYSLADAIKEPIIALQLFRTAIPSELLNDSTFALQNESYIVYDDFYKLLAISLLFAVVGAIIYLLGLVEKSRAAKSDIDVETVVIN